ncbi:scavenger receptor class B member 1-like [Amyelois transitella]|uniref:scavenger receptor class B member 1-like n=1 Tax=Amyelois transitella TaxID=680683 RepID=UPI00067CF17B|nr:scavenger receptor class B member 1-like [Amyelois transitella]
MSHLNLENVPSTALMLPKDEKVVVIPAQGVGKILIREDTILAGLQGCAGCGRAQFSCAGVKSQWSVLCWGRQSDRKYYFLVTLLSAIFVLSLIGTIFFCFTNAINDAILSNMVIRNNSLAFSIWRRPNVQPLMKVRLFNYTNWERVRDGFDEKLTVEEVGPYVYAQQLERVNIDFEGDQLSFQERNYFRYMPELTSGAHFDQVVVPNLPLLGVISKAKDMDLNRFQEFSLQTALNFVQNKDAFIRLPVHRFLWGYEDTIIDSTKLILSLQGKLKFKQFGLLATKNDTLSDRMTINTGEVDKDKMNLIEKLEGEDHLNFWGSPECNSIEGSDGSIFPPSQLDRNRTLHVFMPNLCRRLPYIYDKDIEVDGIPLLRYRLPLDVFDDPEHNPQNQCYCEIDTATCPPRGVINVTACTMGAPAMVSFPHFYLGDPQLREEILGLRPDPVLHDSYLDIHPTLGLSLNGKSSLQINFQVRKTGMFTSLGFLKQGIILPVAWIEMSLDELPESLRSLIYHGTYSTAAVQLGLTVTCVVALVVSAICLLMLLFGRRPKPCATLKVPTEKAQFS